MNLEIQQILTQALGFFILLFILKKFAWKPLLALLEERREKISSEFKNIEQVKSELSRLEEDYKAKLADIDTQARLKIQEAIAEAQRISIEIQEKSRDEAKKTLDKAKANIELEIAKARVDLRNQVASIAIKAAEKVLKEELNEEKHRRLVMGFIEDLEQVR
ncbi:MAG: ATP synthase F0 subunit B [Nitrospirae bacterium RIFCSPLOW2_12_42_9]|nr:MAG: ATP synthase F0 subunit B [Nitrospirae bacterium GWA2_42_11]OGW54357.1 MAG: ATP synthase F0 subunit B [Nitrospirae bacterium RIFCSPLOWO2_02_42_7]OGW58910.1 MAG: ATP synthase F0 subunit B [Nitrospirae bacterium RIFCSPLOW2_12_42_9]OGW60200.1 MAG: ATP synthase F0 subunit B [Nitrospirae bacterium RIFCSPHIGHO2_02_FULL_42_12]HAS18339.1 ATP synthase F0 subunit B [Nitrospiraceae bacterium]